MVLHFPKHNKKDIKNGWHFVIVPTKQMKKDEYIIAAVRLLAKTRGLGKMA